MKALTVNVRAFFCGYTAPFNIMYENFGYKC
jgi:hypothetical protein